MFDLIRLKIKCTIKLLIYIIFLSRATNKRQNIYIYIYMYIYIKFELKRKEKWEDMQGRS